MGELTTLFKGIADSIRAVTGSTEEIAARDFPEAIAGIDAGGVPDGKAIVVVQPVGEDGEPVGGALPYMVDEGTYCIELPRVIEGQYPKRSLVKGSATSGETVETTCEVSGYKYETRIRVLLPSVSIQIKFAPTMEVETESELKLHEYAGAGSDWDVMAAIGPRGVLILRTLDKESTYQLGYSGRRFFGDSISAQAMTELHIGDAVTKVDTSAFIPVRMLKELTFGARMTAVSSIGSTTGDNDAGGFPLLEALDVPVNVTSISGFENYKRLRSVRGASVSSIGSFSGCSKLEEIDLPALAEIGPNAFAYCPTIPSLDFPGVTAVGKNIATNCYAVTRVSFPSMTRVPEYTFNNMNANGLKEIDLSNATSIDQYAMQGVASADCPPIALDFPKVTTVANRGLAYNPIKSVTLGSPGNPVTSINSSAFTGLKNTGTKITIYTATGQSTDLTGSPWGASTAEITYLQA